MKKTLIAMAAVAVAGVASAQVSLTGTFNVDMQNTTSVSSKTIGVGDAILSASASEDLGGGMAVAVNTTFQTKGGRGQTVSNNGYSFDLSGGFGKFTVKSYLSGAGGLSAGISAANDMNTIWRAYYARTRIQYTFPALADGLSAYIKWDKNSATNGTVSDFSTTGYNVSYASGPFSIGTNGSNAAGAKNDLTVTFDAGVAKVAAYSAGNNTEFTLTAPVGAMNVGMHIARGDAAATGVVASYALSKRTALSYNYVNQTKGGTIGSNYRVRLGHSF
ncbi:MAG: hypothetical protein QNL66_03945 [Burkholderiaceae bacterium]